MAKKTISAKSSNGNHEFTLTVIEDPISTDNIINNESEINIFLDVSTYVYDGEFHDREEAFAFCTVNINGDIHTVGVYSYDGGSKELYSDARFIKHNIDGTKTIPISFEITDANGIYFFGNASASGTMTLIDIPRKAVITSAPNFNDEEDPTITYNNPVGDTIGKLEACISLTGQEDDIEYREIDINGTSYTFELTEAERTILREATLGSNKRNVLFIIRTTDFSNNMYWSSLRKELTIVNANPVITNFTAVDTNPDTLALTGNADTIIKGHSTVNYTFNATAIKGATLTNYYVTNSPTNTSATGTISNLESGQINYSVKDSRGNWAYGTIHKTFINYVNLSVRHNVKINIADEGSATITVDVNGNYYNGSFGKVDNVLIIYYRIAENDGEFGEWQLADAISSYDGNTYNSTYSITGLNHESSYTIQTAAQDKIETVGSALYTAKLNPVFNWGKDSFNFNVPVYLQNGALLNTFETAVINSDVNNLTNCGAYRVSEKTTNFPISNGGILVNFCHPGLFVFQIAVNYEPSTIYVRTNWYGTWHSWKRVSVT